MINLKSIFLTEGKGFYHGIWETMMQETARYMKPVNTMITMAGGPTDRKSGKLTWGKPGNAWFAELTPTNIQRDGTAMHGLLTVECKEAMADQLWDKLSSKFLGNMKPGDPSPGYSARTWVINIDSAMRAAGMINWLATNVKSGVNESYAWERKSGEPLPTMKTVQEKYQKNLKEQDNESMSGDSNNYQVIKTPTGKFKIGVVSPQDGKLYDAAQFFGGGTYWQKEYATQQEAQAAIVAVKQSSQSSGNNDQEMMESKRNRNIDMTIVEALAYYGFTTNEAVALKLMMNPSVNLRRVKALYENAKLPEKAATRQVAAYLGTDAVLLETYDASKIEAYIEVYHMYKDGKLDKDTFYKFMDILEPHEREELKGYISTRRDQEMMEEAEKKEKAKKYPRWQDNDGDGKWYEAGDDVSEGEDVPDLGRLNMGSLEESKFWGKIKGNLNGHDYILREEFRK